MQYGFIIPRGDVETIVALATEAEEAGWDGVFYWDGISIGWSTEDMDVVRRRIKQGPPRLE